MNINSKLVTLFATGSILVSAIPAFAASTLTAAFVANVRPNVDFLDSSSRLAIDNSANPRVRAFAHSEALEQTITSNSLVAWTQANTPPGAVVALVGTPVDGPLAPIADIANLPLGVASNVTSSVAEGVGDVITGRSVAIDNPLAPLAPLVTIPAAVGSRLLPAEQDDLARLHDLKGRSFDALYRSTQADALRQLATLYTDYSRNGDDPALRAITNRELPKINRRLAELRRL